MTINKMHFTCVKSMETPGLVKVKIRIIGTVNDLHAADSRNLVDCNATFMTSKHAHLAASKAFTSTKSIERAFEKLCEILLDETLNVWNAVELFQTYILLGSTKQEKHYWNVNRTFEKKISYSSGEANILFKLQGPALFKVVNANYETYRDTAKQKLAKIIRVYCKHMDLQRQSYNTRLQNDTIENSLTPTLMKLLSEL